MTTASLVLAVGLPIAVACGQPCGNPWTLHQGPGPSARSRHATAYDSVRGKVVLFGGENPAELGDTWEWTATGGGGGGTWSLRATSGPPPLHSSGLAYDSGRQRTVLFGGTNAAGQFTNQTWEWNGTTWTQIQATNAPPPMTCILMAYDGAQQRTVLVSTTPIGVQGYRTFEYDGASWTQMPDATPTIFQFNAFSIAFDAARQRMVLIGRVLSQGAPGYGTWEREAAGWVLKNFQVLPTTSAGRALTYDFRRSRVVMVDHQAYSGATAIWVYNGADSTWQVENSGGPPLAALRQPVFDAAGGQLVLFGGENGQGKLDQTWLCRSDIRSGPTLTEIGVRTRAVALGGPAFVLPVAAAGSASFRWRLNGVDLSDGGSFSGTSTPQLTIDPDDVAISGDYDCMVTDVCGSTVRPSTRVNIDCYANCDGTGGGIPINGEDFICFLVAYNNGCISPVNCYPNCDGSTTSPILTANDFVCFINAFVRGCG